MYIFSCTYPKRVYICIINNKPTMTHSEFARRVFAKTNSQAETVEALLNEFIELDEETAEMIAIEAYEDYQEENGYKGEQQSDIERGN